MNAEINDIINKNLPAQVGEVLKQRLILADQEAQRLKDALGAIESLTREIKSLERQVRENNEIRARIDALNKGEAKLLEKQVALDKDEAVLKVRTEMTNQMIGMNKDIVLAVFANNKMKYSESALVPFAFHSPPTPNNSFPSPQTTTLTANKTIEVTGG
jgi:hypothetical protein